MTQEQQLSPVVDMEGVIGKVESLLLDASKYYDHLVSDTIPQYYNELLITIIADLTTIPVEREMLNLGPLEDKESVMRGCNVLAKQLATYFGMSDAEVYRELIAKMNDFPIEDVREARAKMRQGLLN